MDATTRVMAPGMFKEVGTDQLPPEQDVKLVNSKLTSKAGKDEACVHIRTYDVLQMATGCMASGLAQCTNCSSLACQCGIARLCHELRKTSDACQGSDKLFTLACLNQQEMAAGIHKVLSRHHTERLCRLQVPFCLLSSAPSGLTDQLSTSLSPKLHGGPYGYDLSTSKHSRCWQPAVVPGRLGYFSMTSKVPVV